MSDVLHERDAGKRLGKPEAGVDVTPIVAKYGAAFLRLIDLPSVPLDEVDFELQRMPREKQERNLRLVVHVQRTESNDATSGQAHEGLPRCNKARPAVLEPQGVTEIGSLPVDIRRGRIGTILLSEDDRQLLDEKCRMIPARTRLLRVCQMVRSMWERWTYSDRPDSLRIADINEILRWHNKEKLEQEGKQQAMTTLGEFWNAGGMLVELINRSYGYLGANEREKLEIRWYLLEKAGYLPGAS
jgi:hypothetical protein